MQSMDLNAAPLGTISEPPLVERRRSSSRRSSQATVFRVSSSSTSTTRRVTNTSKQPLGVDLTFGNSPSTVRHFKRVPSGERRAAPRSSPPPDQSNQVNWFNPQAPTFRPSPPNPAHHMDVNNENAPPTPDYPPMPVTKDALYGRRAYSKVLDSVFQEAYADSGSAHQREALGRVSQAWAQLDEVDPHGEFLLLKAMVDRLKNDSKLATALGLEIAPAKPSTKHNTNASDTSLSGTTIHGRGNTRIRSSTTSRTSTGKVSDDYSSSSPYQTPNSTPMSSPTKGSKLVLAQGNPHAKSHRRRQSGFVGGENMAGSDFHGVLDEKKLPGHVEMGMEQQGLLADILYGQWTQGLRARWPLS